MKKFALLMAQNASKKDTPTEKERVLILLKKAVDGSNQMVSMCILTFLMGWVRYGLSLGGGCCFQEVSVLLFLESHYHSLKRCLKCNVAGEVRIRRET